MGINFLLPAEQNEIPEALTNINQQIKNAKVHVEALEGLRKAMQSACVHPSKHNKYDCTGDYETYCDVCSKWLH